jgi:hypothetical protein
MIVSTLHYNIQTIFSSLNIGGHHSYRYPAGVGECVVETN